MRLKMVLSSIIIEITFSTFSPLSFSIESRTSAWATVLGNGESNGVHQDGYIIEDAKYVGNFRIYGDYRSMSESDTAALVTAYVRHFDESIKEFFGLPEEECSEILLNLNNGKD